MSSVGRGTPVLQSRASLAEEVKTFENFRSMSFAGLLAVGGLGAYIFANLEHPHFNPKNLEYRNINNKDFPWGDGKTSLFGMKNDPDAESPSDAHH